MDIYHIEHVYGATLSMENLEDKKFSLAYNTIWSQTFAIISQSKDYFCIPFMCFLRDFNFSLNR